MKTEHFKKCTIDQVVLPDFSRLDTPKDIILDAARCGFLPELCRLLRIDIPAGDGGRMRTARDVAYELASADNRDFAVDQLIYVTGALRFGPDTLRKFSARHGFSHEWFRRNALELADRLMLKPVDEESRNEGGAR